MEPILIEALLTLFAITATTQVVAPLILNKTIFWLFRKTSIERRERQAIARKQEAERKIRVVALEAEASRLEMKAEFDHSSIMDEEIETLTKR